MESNFSILLFPIKDEKNSYKYKSENSPFSR